MRRVLAGCLVLAAISLVLPSEPTYDPWSWIVWGREVLHLDLDTTGGPSWKPLPVLFTAPFAAAGAINDALPPLLWLWVARAGALLALALAFRLARRLAGPGVPGLAAGAVTAVSLALTPMWLRYAAHGNEAPMAVAAMLWALQCHLDGRRRAAVALALIACLARPEAFPFLALYAAWAWRAAPETRVATLIGAAALPLLWLVPEWIGSGNPLGAGAQAASEPSWSLSRADQPWLALLERAHHICGPVLEGGLVLAALLAVRARERTVPVLACVTVAWVGLVAVMTQAGFSGNARYLLPAMVLGCLLAGVAVGHLARIGPGRMTGPALAVAAVVAAVPLSAGHIRGLGTQARSVRADARLSASLDQAVTRAGGPDAVVHAGAPAIDRAYGPQLAWLTTLHLGDVERSRGRALVFAAGRRDPVSLVAQTEPAVPAMTLRSVDTAGRWRVFAAPARGPADPEAR